MIILSVTTDYISFHAVVEISGEFINQTHNSVSWVSHAVIGFTGFATFINCISIIFSTEYAISKKAS
jgi:intracellular septation protein A